MGVTSGEKAILWRVAAQIEIVGSKLVGRAARQAGGLGGLREAAQAQREKWRLARLAVFLENKM
jgi:hypothetical protein